MFIQRVSLQFEITKEELDDWLKAGVLVMFLEVNWSLDVVTFN